MDDAAFWALIEDRSAIAVELALAKLPGDEIVAWSARFDAYMAVLDRWDLKLATHVILDGWYDPTPVSAWLISRGRAALEAAIADPDMLEALDHSDDMLGVAGRAYRRACKLDLPAHAPAMLEHRWPPDRVSRLEPWTGALVREHLPRLYKRHLKKKVARGPEDWDAMISRAEFWRLIAEANGGLTMLAQCLDTPDAAVGFERWRRHFHAELERRVGLQVAAHVLGVELRPFVSWLLLQGERVVYGAIEDADTLADHPWVGMASRALEEIGPDAVRRLRLYVEYWRVRIPEEAWPEDLPETAANIVGSDMLARWFPKLAAKYTPPVPERFPMPRAPWQIELAGRNRWWALAWDAAERETTAMDLEEFWRHVAKLDWPRGTQRWLTAAPLLERLAFAMRFHERVAAYGEGGELAIAGGRDAYEERRTIGAAPGLTTFVDELRRSSVSELWILPATKLEDAIGLDGAVVFHQSTFGFVQGSSILLHDGVVPMPLPTRRPYSPKETFAVGDQISHPSFGNGVVVEKLSGKIKISFDDRQERVLASK
ncbi:MAG: DUF4240 domain-containing protein [Myxococcota bacterium]|nr:DUF4240 domain-containing protein [Myxococcota bacterium]